MVKYDKINTICGLRGTVYEYETTIDPPSIGAHSDNMATPIDVTGIAKVGDIVIGISLADPSTLGGVAITSALIDIYNSTLYLYLLFNNPTAGAIDPTATTYKFRIFRPMSVLRGD